MTHPIKNALTVDVEDYFHVSAFEGHISRADWDRLPCRVERNTDRMLALFAEHDAKATFFILGWVAERYPQLIRRIADAGHEVASHGWSHVRATQQTPDQFHADVSGTRKLLQDTSGQPVEGFRAASFSIGSDNLWALDVLGDVGYRYSSSIYPVRHDLYGMPDAPRFPFRYTPDQWGQTRLIQAPDQRGQTPSVGEAGDRVQSDQGGLTPSIRGGDAEGSPTREGLGQDRPKGSDPIDPGDPMGLTPLNGHGILEIPITTVRVFGQNLPTGGGGYFRLLPYPIYRWALTRVNELDRQPGVFYCHPWEIDPGQPRQQGIGWKTRFRHYTNLGRMEGRLRRLLTDFAWGRMDDVFL